MARIYTQKTRKPRVCGRCRKDIAVGEQYRSSFPGGPYAHRTLIRCMNGACSIRPSEMTSSDKLSTIYGALETLEECSEASALADQLSISASEIRQAGEEYSESADNMEQYFEGSSQVEDIREKADNAEALADALEQAQSEVDDLCTQILNIQTLIDNGAFLEDKEKESAEEPEFEDQEAAEHMGTSMADRFWGDVFGFVRGCGGSGLFGISHAFDASVERRRNDDSTEA